MQAPVQEIALPWPGTYDVRLFIKREDLLFPLLSGNKYRKLKYNLLHARETGHDTLLTFGGAYSNHLHATAAAGKRYGFRTIGLVRGEELAAAPLNPTLAAARRNGMQLEFLTRERYRQKTAPDFLASLGMRYGQAYVLPEGGTNERAVQGCAEILGPGDREFSHVCCAVGTGGTLAGLARAAAPEVQVRGYPALRAAGLEASLRSWIPGGHWSLVGDYHFGGYARMSRELVEFINGFKGRTGVPLDPVYTGKMLYGILSDIRSGKFPRGSQILAIHTGGLQGRAGMNMRLAKKNLPLLRL